MRDRLVNLLIRIPGAAAMRCRVLWLRLLGMRLSGRCWVRRIHVPRNPWDIDITEAMLDDDVVLLTTGKRKAEPRIVIGRGCYLNRFTIVDATERIEFGEGCFVGPHCYITDHDHGTKKDQLISKQPLAGSPVRLGRDVWVGASVTILKGVHIGDGAVIGAGAVVTKSVNPYTVVVGVPAAVIKKRE